MVEHLVLMVVEALVERQREEQQAPLATRVPQTRALYGTPDQAFAEGEVVIPAQTRSTSMAVILGLLVGLGVGVVMFLVLARGITRAPWFRNLPKPQRVLATGTGLALCLVPPVLFPLALRRAAQGGTLILRRNGAEFRHGSRAVFCPWILFREPRSYRGDSKRVVVPVHAPSIDRVELLWQDRIIGCGRDARLRSFRFLDEDEVELRNVYTASMRDIAELLQHLGRRYG